MKGKTLLQTNHSKNVKSNKPNQFIHTIFIEAFLVKEGAIMDLQEYVDQFDSMTCIMSVEKKPNGYGKMRIEVGNKAYIDSFKKNNDNLIDILFH